MSDAWASDEQPPAPPLGTPSVCRSRDEIMRRELKHFAQRTLRRELRDFGARLQSAISGDLRRMLVGRVPGSPADGSFACSSLACEADGEHPSEAGAALSALAPEEALRFTAWSNFDGDVGGSEAPGTSSLRLGGLKKSVLDAEGAPPQDPPSKKAAKATKAVTFEGISSDVDGACKEKSPAGFQRSVSSTSLCSTDSVRTSTVESGGDSPEDEPEEPPLSTPLPGTPAGIAFEKTDRSTYDSLPTPSDETAALGGQPSPPPPRREKREGSQRQSGRFSRSETRSDSAAKSRASCAADGDELAGLPMFFGFKKDKRQDRSSRRSCEGCDQAGWGAERASALERRRDKEDKLQERPPAPLPPKRISGGSGRVAPLSMPLDNPAELPGLVNGDSHASAGKEPRRSPRGLVSKSLSGGVRRTPSLGFVKRMNSSTRRTSLLYSPEKEVSQRLPTFLSFRTRSPRTSAASPRPSSSTPVGSPRADCRYPSTSSSNMGRLGSNMGLKNFGHLRLDKRPSECSFDGRSTVQSTVTLTGIGKFHAYLQAFVHNLWFDWLSALLVFVNAVCIGWQTDYIARASTDLVPPAFRVIDALFCVVFTGELLLRLAAGGMHFWIGSEWRWNIFDVVMVTLQISEEFTSLLAETPSSNFSYLRLLRLLRLVRVLRIVRVLRFIRELRKLVCSIGNSLQSLFWTLVLILFMLYVVGVCITQFVSNFAREEDGGKINTDLQMYFGSLDASVISLFQAMTGGVDWDDLSRPLGDIHSTLIVFFALYIAFAVLAMMNVVTGVFVDSAISASQKDQEKDIVMRIKEFYQDTDADGNGKLTWDEFETQLAQPGSEDVLNHIGLNTADAKQLFELLDVNDDGEVDWDEFVMGCLRLRGPAKSVDLITLMYETKRNIGRLQDQTEEALQLLSAMQFAGRYSGHQAVEALC